jgi:hypothetical protein
VCAGRGGCPHRFRATRFGVRGPGARSEEAAVPDARGALQALESRAGRESRRRARRRHGFEVTTLEGYKQDSSRLDLSIVTPEYLARYDGVMLMTNGNLPLTTAQKQAIVDYVRAGHGLVGVHCATLTLYDYPEFGRLLGGYYRRSIVPTARIDERHVGVLKVEDPNHPPRKCLAATGPLSRSSISSARKSGTRADPQKT